MKATVKDMCEYLKKTGLLAFRFKKKKEQNYKLVATQTSASKAMISAFAQHHSVHK